MTTSRLAVLALLLFTLVGCSSTTFLYNRLDFLIPWYMGDYVKLTRPQKNNLGELLDPFLTWHRREELPRYLEVLIEIEAGLDSPASAEHVGVQAEEFVAAWERIELRSLEWMLSLGEQLSDEQMAEFIGALWEKQRDYEEEYLPRSEQEYRQEAYENLLDSMQDFLGRLDWGQRGILEEAAAQLQRSDGIWLQEREHWVRRMEAQLRREPGWQEGVRDLLATRDNTTSPQYAAIFAHNSQVIYSAVAQLINSRSDKQDRRLRKKLGNFREDIEQLIAQ